MEKEKILHDYKCQECGKPAIYNFQDGGYIKWEILPDGSFKKNKSWAEGDTENEFYCEEHEHIFSD